MLDPLFSYRAERRPDAGADLRDSRLGSLGIRQLHHDGFRLTDNPAPMVSVSIVRTSADLPDFLSVDINDDLISQHRQCCDANGSPAIA
jgi:hypothetical protein